MRRKCELISGESLVYECCMMCGVMMVMSLLTGERENQKK